MTVGWNIILRTSYNYEPPIILITFIREIPGRGPEWRPFFYKYVPMASSLSTPIDVIPRKKHRGRLNLIQDLPELGNKYNYMDK